MALSNKKYVIPQLLRITNSEAESIANMFRLYDYKSTSRIPRYLCMNLVKTLGFGHGQTQGLPPEVSLKELLLWIDQRTPEPVPEIACSLFSYLNMVSDKDGKINAKAISDFYVTIGRPPCSVSEANLLLTHMLEYDDCSEMAVVDDHLLDKEVTLFTKKNNALKDFH